MGIDYLKSELRQLADPAKASVLQRFFKTGKGQYGEGDRFLGVVVPKQRAVAKKYWRELSLGELDKLIKSPFHEERLTALFVLVFKYRCSNTSPQDKKEIYEFYLKHTRYINNWDLVDLSAPNILGAYLFDKDKSILFRLAKSKNLWEKRIAVLSTLYFIYYGRPDETLKIAEILLEDKHDLIHKAVGWMLRETGKRIDRNLTEKFLKKHYQRISRTTLRYAIEKFPDPLRKQYLKKTRN